MSDFTVNNVWTAAEAQELRDAGPVMIHQHKGKQECLTITGNTNPRVILTALRMLRAKQDEHGA